MTENKIHINKGIDERFCPKDSPTRSTSTMEEDRGAAQALAHEGL